MNQSDLAGISNDRIQWGLYLSEYIQRNHKDMSLKEQLELREKLLGPFPFEFFVAPHRSKKEELIEQTEKLINQPIFRSLLGMIKSIFIKKK